MSAWDGMMKSPVMEQVEQASELDKRRQRIQELQMKRKEELETKRLQIAAEQGSKSEAERSCSHSYLNSLALVFLFCSSFY